MHHKFAVIDVHGAHPRVITGSYNWTAAGAESNDENTLIIHDAATAQAYYQEYLRLYGAIPPGCRVQPALGRVGHADVQRRDRQQLRQSDRRRLCAWMAWTTTATARWIPPTWAATAAGWVRWVSLGVRPWQPASRWRSRCSLTRARPADLRLGRPGRDGAERHLRLVDTGQVHGDGQRDQLVLHGERQPEVTVTAAPVRIWLPVISRGAG
jgi:hypothetical protein